MNILFYTPVNFRCRDIESLAKKYSDDGNKVYLLSQCDEGIFHDAFRSMGLQASSDRIKTKSAFFRIIKQVISVIQFCADNEIDLVYSHLEPTNFVSVIAQYFIRARVIIYRHHIDAAKLFDFDKSITYQLTYKMAQTVISVSRQGMLYMIENEKVASEKIVHINLGYDFLLYEEADMKTVMKIRSCCDGILLITVGRLTKYKRSELSLNLVREARLMGLNVSLLILGEGEEEENLKELAVKYNIRDNVFFGGFTHRILDHLAAADFLIHPSISESSCVVIKEAGLVELPVIVCGGIGDFDDYMKNEINSVVVDKEKFVEEALVHLHHYITNRNHYRALGKRLKEDIFSRFSIDKVFDEYSRFRVNN